jgi:hypothetical protein
VLNPKVDTDSDDEEDVNFNLDINLDLNRPEIQWEEFLSAVPGLEELHIERGELEAQQLRLLAFRLPNLRMLVVGFIDFDEAWRIFEKPGLYAGTQAITIRSQFDFGHPSEISVFAAARFVILLLRSFWGLTGFNTHATRCIYDTWPNAKCEMNEMTTVPDETPGNKRDVIKLNGIIESLRSMGTWG